MASVSMYSATVMIDMPRASCAIARTMDSARGSFSTSRTMLPSIFSMVTGNWRRHESEDRPVPKSSSATPHPSSRRRHISASARPRFATVAVSVSSKQNSVGSRPLEVMRSISRSEKASSFRDWPEKLMAKPSAWPSSTAARGLSASITWLMTQRSMSGIIW